MAVTPLIGDSSPPLNGNGSRMLTPNVDTAPSAVAETLSAAGVGDNVSPDSTELTVQRTRQWWREAQELLAERARIQHEVEVVLDGQIAKASSCTNPKSKRSKRSTSLSRTPTRNNT